MIVPPKILPDVTESLARSEVPTERLSISLAPTAPVPISSIVRELFNTFAEVIALLLIVILFHVPPISPANWTLPAEVVVAYGILAVDPIDTQALASQRYTISSSMLYVVHPSFAASQAP